MSCRASRRTSGACCVSKSVGPDLSSFPSGVYIEVDSCSLNNGGIQDGCISASRHRTRCLAGRQDGTRRGLLALGHESRPLQQISGNLAIVHRSETALKGLNDSQIKSLGLGEKWVGPHPSGGLQ